MHSKLREQTFAVQATAASYHIGKLLIKIIPNVTKGYRTYEYVFVPSRNVLRTFPRWRCKPEADIRFSPSLFLYTKPQHFAAYLLKTAQFSGFICAPKYGVDAVIIQIKGQDRDKVADEV